ncbi:MAG: Autotransporter-associated beta strand repeat protein, partial [Pedosphaera sp.]|nr:Autotransporter-associated beta strand repeat protein [Pedosphaera sp.]
ANAATLALINNSTISQAAGATITEANLRLSSAGPVTLDEANHVGTLAASANGGLSFTDADDLTVGTVDGVNGISTVNNAITLTADGLNVAQAINSGSARTIVQQLSAGRAIDLGSETAGKLSLTDSELDLITAGVLQVGNASAGSITISAAISPANVNTLALVNNGAISETGAGAVTVNNLRLSTPGAVTLNGANHVDTLAAAANGGVSFTDADALTVGTVDTVNGVSTVNNAITLTADSLNVAQGINSGTARTIVQQLTAGRAIDLGSETGGKLSLTDSELDLVTAGVLQVGNASAGGITISAAISPANVNTLALVNNGAITETGAGAVSVNNLRLSTPGAVTLDGANHVGTLAAAANGGVSFTDADGLTLGTVDGVNGVTAANGNISVSTINGALTATRNVDAGLGKVVLSAGSSGNDNVLSIGAGVTVRGKGGVTLVGDQIAIDASLNAATIDAGVSRATLRQFENGTTINLGGLYGAGTLELSQAEIARVHAGVYQIGDLNAGTITFSDLISIDPGALSPNPTATSINATRLNLVTSGSVLQVGGGRVFVPILSIKAGHDILLANSSAINNVNYLASKSATPIHFIDQDTLKVRSDVDWDGIFGVDPQSNFVQGGGGRFGISTLSVQLAGIAYVDVPVLRLGGVNFTARVEANTKLISPPGSIATLGLDVPFPEGEAESETRRIEDHAKWVGGRMVVSGSTTGPQTPK